MALSLNLSMETPENVVLSRELAGPAYRCAAYLIDLGIRLGMLAAAGSLLNMALSGLPGVAMGTLLLVLFFLEWGYAIAFEYFWQGRTPGKHVCGLRVMHADGEPLSWWGAMLRNLVRVGDMLPFLVIYGENYGLLVLLPVYGPGLIAMLLTPRMQRLGDLLAGTVVVHERRTSLPTDPEIYAKIPPLDRGTINAWRPRSETLAVIDQFHARRSVLTYQRGHELASGLATALAEQLEFRGDPDLVRRYPMAFLARVYVTFALAREADEAATTAFNDDPRIPVGATP